MDLSLRRISHVSIFLLFITILKSIFSIAVRSSLASCFGATDATDAYFAAFFVPQQLSDFFIGGILFIVIIPVFQKRMAEAGEEVASKDISSLLNISMLAIGIMTLIYLMLLPWLIPFLFSGFKNEKLILAIRFSKLLSPAILLMALSLMYISFYHAYRDFFIPSIASLMFPLSSLFSIWFLPDSWGIERLIYGNLAGSVIGVIILVACINRRLKWDLCKWDIGNPVIRTTALVSWPIIAESAISKVHPFIQRNLASELPCQGAITMIELSLFLTGSVIAFIAGPIATAIFPMMGQQLIDEDEKAVFRTFIKSVRIVIFLALPINMIMLTESGDIVRLLFGHGKFSEESCGITSILAFILSALIIPNCFSSIGGKVYFVFHETKLISLCAILLTVVTVPLYYVGVKVAGLYGLMGTYAVASIVSSLLIFGVLRFKHPSVSFKELYAFVLPMFLCSIAMGIAIFAVKLSLKYLIIFPLLRLSLVSLAGILVFIMSAKLLKIDELSYIVKRIPYLNSLSGER